MRSAVEQHGLSRQQIGYAAMELAAELAEGGEAPDGPTLFGPTKVSVRGSSDQTVVEDEGGRRNDGR